MGSMPWHNLSQTDLNTMTGGHVQALTRLNAPKVHTEWRQRMRGAKLVELRAEAERMQDAHTRAMHAWNHSLQVAPADLTLALHQCKSCS